MQERNNFSTAILFLIASIAVALSASCLSKHEADDELEYILPSLDLLWHERHAEDYACVNAVEFLPSDELIASAGSDGAVVFFDAATGEEVRKFEIHDDIVWSMAISQDGKNMACALHNDGVTLCDVATGQLLATLGSSGSFNSLAFSPDGLLLAIAHKNVSVWDIASEKLATEFIEESDQSIRGVSFSPDGRWIAYRLFERTLKVYDLETGELKKIFEEFGSFSFSPKGDVMAVLHRNRTVHFFETETWERAKLQIPPIKNFLPSINRFSPDGSLLAIAGRKDDRHKKGNRMAQGFVIIADAHTGEVLWRTPSKNGHIWSIDFSPDGSKLAVGQQFGGLTVWEIPEAK